MIRKAHFTFQPVVNLSSGWDFQVVTANADTGGPGIWRTTDEGNRIFIKGGEARAGGPNGPVISAPSKKKKKTSKPTSKPAASKTPKKDQAEPPVADSPPEKPAPPAKKEAEAPTLPTAEPFKKKLQFGDSIKVEFDDFRSMEEMVEGEGIEEKDAEKLIKKAITQAEKELGPEWQKKIAQMTGIPESANEGAGVWLHVNPDGMIQATFQIEAPPRAGRPPVLMIEAVRSFDFDKKVISNDQLLIEKSLQGQGVGTQMFHQQVQQAVANGFKSIETMADKSVRMNGYYTWARLGYDANLDSLGGVFTDKLPEFPYAKKISDLMKTSEGRKYWKENGRKFKGTFDLKEGSQSRKVLDDYVKAKS